MPSFARSPGLSRRPRTAPLSLEPLEDRCLLAVSGLLTAGGALIVNGEVNAVNHIALSLDATRGQIVLAEDGQVRGLFPVAAVKSIVVNANGLNNVVTVDQALTQPAQLNGGPGNNVLVAGGGTTNLVSGSGVNRLVGGNGFDTFFALLGDNTVEGGSGTGQAFLAPEGPFTAAGVAGLAPQAGNPLAGRRGRDIILGFADRLTVTGLDPAVDHDLRAATSPATFPNTLGIPPSTPEILPAGDVNALLSRAAAATPFDSAIVAIVDRNGRVLGVRVEGGVSPLITQNREKLVFAIDGALAEARTAAFFANDTAPLTSRTIQFISQTTNTQREIESDPNITAANSPLKGPGKVAPIQIGGNFPPGIITTPLVDLFDIEETNRDTTLQPIYNANGDVIANVPRPNGQRFNINPAFIPPAQRGNLLPNLLGVPNQILAPPDSYGAITGLLPTAQPRGIGTLPGGIPIFKNGVLVGGIGVFFPGTTGFADEEIKPLKLTNNFVLDQPNLSLVAEYTAFAAVGGDPMLNAGVGTLGGVAVPQGITFPLPPGMRIDLVGIDLPLVGPPGNNGTQKIFEFGQALGVGDPNSSAATPFNTTGTINMQVTPPVVAAGSVLMANAASLGGALAPEGFLVTPHAGTTLTAAQVQQIIVQGVQQALMTRAQIRLPLDNTTRMVFAVADPVTNEILGLFRMPDSTIFSIDVAAAKSRNNAYYANPVQLQPVDQVPGIPAGVAFSSRTFRFLASPFLPEGINGRPPGFFSILNVPGTDPVTGVSLTPPLPASAFFTNVVGHNDFFPQTNFHQATNAFNQFNQNGVVFFPGGVPLYVGPRLAGGVGVSGDGVDEDDVVTFSAAVGFPPPGIPRADEEFFRGIRLPYQLFNRNPTNL